MCRTVGTSGIGSEAEKGFAEDFADFALDASDDSWYLNVPMLDSPIETEPPEMMRYLAFLLILCFTLCAGCAYTEAAEPQTGATREATTWDWEAMWEAEAAIAYVAAAGAHEEAAEQALDAEEWEDAGKAYVAAGRAWEAAAEACEAARTACGHAAKIYEVEAWE